MKYRNKRTGAIIDVRSEICGENWEQVEEAKASSTCRDSRKYKRKQNG